MAFREALLVHSADITEYLLSAWHCYGFWNTRFSFPPNHHPQSGYHPPLRKGGIPAPARPRRARANHQLLAASSGLGGREEGHGLARSGSGTACGASRQRGSSHSGTIWRRVWPRSPGASGWEARCASNCSLHMFEQIPVGRWRDNVCWAGRPVPCKLHAPSPSPFNLYLCSCV